MFAYMHAAKYLTTEAEPTIILNNNRTLAYQSLWGYRLFDIFITMRMVGDVNMSGKQHMFSYLNTIYGSYAAILSDPSTFAYDYLWIVGYTRILDNRS